MPSSPRPPIFESPVRRAISRGRSTPTTTPGGTSTACSVRHEPTGIRDDGDRSPFRAGASGGGVEAGVGDCLLRRLGLPAHTRTVPAAAGGGCWGARRLPPDSLFRLVGSGGDSARPRPPGGHVSRAPPEGGG